MAPSVTVPEPQREAGVVPVMLGVDLILTTEPAEVAEQLLPVVTVTEYVPPAVTVIDWVVAPPELHR